VAKKALPAHLQVPWPVLLTLGIFVAAWFILPIGIILVLVLIGMFFPPAHELVDVLQSNNLTVSFSFDLFTAAAALGMVYLVLRHYKLGWKSVGWRKVNLWKALAYLVGGFIVFSIFAALIIALVSYVFPSFNANQSQNNDFTASVKTHFSLTLIALVIIPPIIEETVFRGFIFPAIARKWGIWGGAIASSALFGLAHWQANVSIYTFALGLVLCFLYVKLKSIFPGMLIHMLNNLLAFYVLTSK
jgi:membrane protease YdiL (CAAX protease family)